MRALSVLLPLFLASALPAAMVVNQTGDSGPGTLRAALTAANASPDRDLITFALPTGSLITLASALPITQPVHILGPGPRELTVSGADVTRVFDIATGAPTSLEGLTIADGRAGTAAGILTLSNLDLIDVSVRDCDATSGSGGALRQNEGNLSAVNCQFLRNSTSSFGGALYSANNTAHRADFVRSVFASNESTQGGGAIYYGTSTLTSISIEDCRFVDNRAGGTGGAVDLVRSATRITGSEFVGNSNERDDFGGGAFSISSATNVATTIENCTFFGNRSNSSGGAISILAFSIVEVRNCTIVGNTADANSNGSGSGGGLFSGATAISETRLRNTVIAGNFDTGGERPDIHVDSGTFVSEGHNFIGNVGTYDFASNTAGDFFGDPNGTTTAHPQAIEGFVPLDPRLDPIAWNGGLTRTMAVQSGSLTVAAGDPVDFPATDQRGAPRPYGGGPEIGAYEAQPHVAAQMVASPFSTAAGASVEYRLEVVTDPIYGADDVSAEVTLDSSSLAGSPEITF